jgi:hypothetical protein
MSLCEGDVVQYDKLRYGLVDVFIIKLINFAARVEAERNSKPSGLPI